MAFDPAERLPRRVSAGLRRVDYLERSLCSQPKHGSGSGGVRMHGAVRKVRHHQDSVRAWVVLGVTGPTGGAALALLAIKGHL